ncbi:MAG: hypothetical protein CMI53_01780 [Parcubacteria group bacterium]|jgi:hypothetical protein|nr:hypothetical protein [Parcubacteria group bacterium]|tara:strand:+ start:8135 stop:8458 length:324 start_codon:yes stop_codon:yes gene_type:complete
MKNATEGGVAGLATVEAKPGICFPALGCHNGVCGGFGVLHARKDEDLIEGCTPSVNGKSGNRINFMSKVDPNRLPCFQCAAGATVRIECHPGREKEFGRSEVRHSSI